MAEKPTSSCINIFLVSKWNQKAAVLAVAAVAAAPADSAAAETAVKQHIFKKDAYKEKRKAD